MVIYRNNSKMKFGPAVKRDVDERLFIGTLGLNCVDYTRKCIDTVQTRCKEVRFVYIDNGSTKENVELISTWKKNNQYIDDFLIGINGYNAGVAVGWNQLIRMALEWGATKILICNNDVAFGAHTIDGLVEAYNKIRLEKPETVMVTGANRTRVHSLLSDIKQVWNYHEHPDFACFMITPETIDRIGFFSEDYMPAFFEDNDMHWRIMLRGYKAYATDWAPYSHIGSRTRYTQPDVVSHRQFRFNRGKFFQNNLTNTVDQSVAQERYDSYIKAYPNDKHPSLESVQRHAYQVGLVTDDLVNWLNNLSEQDLAG